MFQPLTIEEFIDNTICDIKEPLKSGFISKIANVRSTVYGIDEGLENDRNVLLRTRKLLKSVVSSGYRHVENVLGFCKHLDKLGEDDLESREQDDCGIASSLCQFSVILRDLASMLKQSILNMNNILVFPIETFMQGDTKSDFKKPFEKVLKEYEYKYDKLRKEKVQVMKETGIFTPETLTPEMIRDLDEERRRIQLETCEYLVKANELKFKRSTDLVQHLVDFYYSQFSYFRECLSMMEHFGKTVNELAERVNRVQQQHDGLKNRLIETREAVRHLFTKEPIQPVPTGYSQPSASSQNYGTTKMGYLLKKSEGKVKRVWQRRKVHIGGGTFCLYHADENKPPVRLPLLTCQLKVLNESAEGAPPGESHSGPAVDNRNCFDLVSNCRTYNFQTEDDDEYEEWICILNNALREEFQRAMHLDRDQQQPSQPSLSSTPFSKLQPSHDNTGGESCLKGNSLGGGESLAGSDNGLPESSSPTTHSRDSRLSHVGSIGDAFSTEVLVGRANEELAAGDPGYLLYPVPSRSEIQSALVNHRFGTRYCADCDRPNPDWVSVNLGVLICLDCCGVHRELGVHYSRTQSLTMDDLSASQLLLPHYVGNCLFNRIFESSLPVGQKPSVDQNASIARRRCYIKSKYVDRLFVAKSTATSIGTALNGFTAGDSLRQKLLSAVKTSDLSALIQVYAENFDLMTPLQASDFGQGDFTEPEHLQSTGTTTALHIAIEETVSVSASDRTLPRPRGHGNLPLVEFIIQNSPLTHLQRTNALGETGLHHAVRHARLDSLKLLLQAGGLPTPLLNATNLNGQTAHQLGLHLLATCHSSGSLMADCVSLLRLAIEANESKARVSSNLSAGVITAAGGASDALTGRPPSATADTQTARGELVRAVNCLSSVDWNLHVDTELTVADQLPLPSQHNSLALGESVVPAHRDANLPTSPCSPSRSSCLSTIWDNSNSQGFSLTKSGVATLPRKKGFAPHPPSFSLNDDRARRECTGITPPSPDDHIDVLLDVLEEKPDSASPIAPPVPAKPRPELLKMFYSTLPNRRPASQVKRTTE